MKRSLVVALIIGAVVSALIIGLHSTGVILPLEESAIRLLPGGEETTRVVGVRAQYALVILLSIGVSWMVLMSSRRKRLGWPLGIIAFQLVTLSWVCLLYQVFFQPLPSILAIGLGFVTAYSYSSYGGRKRAPMAYGLFSGRLSEDQLTRLSTGDLPFDEEAKTYETTTVVCDIANKHDLADEASPAVVAQLTEKFMRHARQSFLDAGAFIESVGGEGIVAVFGFPAEDPNQAEKATRHALSLLSSFESMNVGGKDGAPENLELHFGISSGTTIVAPVQVDSRTILLTTGEPVELARRFCIANRFYGSRILMGPRTFELTSKVILARPIDFLSGVDVRERHEIYEPLTLAAEATPEQIARRDSFWNGVVLYREKRWGEAYTQFQEARGPNEREDAPLQLYLRRIEPLALHLAMSGDD